MDRLRVLLADDHLAICEKVAALLTEEFEIVAVVTNGREALEAEKKLQPDVVVLDISMPILNGIDTAASLQQRNSKAKVVFLTIHSEAQFVRAALAAGALGYVVKSHLATDLLPAIHEVVIGHQFISPVLQAPAKQHKN